MDVQIKHASLFSGRTTGGTVSGRDFHNSNDGDDFAGGAGIDQIRLQFAIDPTRNSPIFGAVRRRLDFLQFDRLRIDDRRLRKLRISRRDKSRTPTVPVAASDWGQVAAVRKQKHLSSLAATAFEFNLSAHLHKGVKITYKTSQRPHLNSLSAHLQGVKSIKTSQRPHLNSIECSPTNKG